MSDWHTATEAEVLFVPILSARALRRHREKTKDKPGLVKIQVNGACFQENTATGKGLE